MIGRPVDIDRIVDHHCLEVLVWFIDIGGIIVHHCLEVILCLLILVRIIDHNCLDMIVRFVDVGVNCCPSLLTGHCSLC